MEHDWGEAGFIMEGEKEAVAKKSGCTCRGSAVQVSVGGNGVVCPKPLPQSKHTSGAGVRCMRERPVQSRP